MRGEIFKGEGGGLVVEVDMIVKNLFKIGI